MRLAISYALSQSVKLSVYETRAVAIVDETKDLPSSLAAHGKVNISSKQIAKLMGKIFLQRSALNLQGSVLDTPEFFWHQQDATNSLYRSLIEYLELSERIDILNSRFTVLHEMLDLLRNNESNAHGVRLEWIVIWLIAIECLAMVVELFIAFGVLKVAH